MDINETAPWAPFVNRFYEKSVLVIGDMMLDRFIWGRVERISQEAPVPVVEVQRESAQPGGASNVVNNVVALGASACMAGVVGDDEEGRILRRLLQDSGVDVTGVVEERARPTTVKTRIVAHSQQLVRFDRERSRSLSEDAERSLEAAVVRELATVDAVIFSDYDKGVISPPLVDTVKAATRERQIPVLANPKPRNLNALQGITSIQVNLVEAEQTVGFSIRGEGDVERAAESLLARFQSEHLMVTLGSRGLALYSRGEAPILLPAAEVPVYDVAGAGDTVISAFTLALSSGAPLRLAAEFANLAAGAVVRKVGVATASPGEVLTLHRELQAAHRSETDPSVPKNG